MSYDIFGVKYELSINLAATTFRFIQRCCGQIMTTPLPLTFRLSRNWLYLVTTTLICILVFQLVSIRDSAGHADFNPLLRGDVARYIINLAYYFPLELVTVGVMLGVLSIYRRGLKLYWVWPTAVSLLKYQLIYLPAVLLGIGLACPVTNTLRYAILYAHEYGWAYYFPGYCFTWRMYLMYVTPVGLFSYSFLNVNLVLDYMSWHQNLLVTLRRIRQNAPSVHPSGSLPTTAIQALTPELDLSQPISVAPSYLTVIDAVDRRGRTVLPVNQVCFFAVQGKRYQVHTTDSVYEIHLSFKILVTQLDPSQFLRISRGIIVNIHYVENYSYWEYDKFIVRLKNNTRGFVMQRSHLNSLKLLLVNRNQPFTDHPIIRRE